MKNKKENKRIVISPLTIYNKHLISNYYILIIKICNYQILEYIFERFYLSKMIDCSFRDIGILSKINTIIK